MKRMDLLATGISGGAYQPAKGKDIHTQGSANIITHNVNNMFTKDPFIMGTKHEPMGIFHQPESNFFGGAPQPKTKAKTQTFTTKTGAKVTVREKKREADTSSIWDF